MLPLFRPEQVRAMDERAFGRGVDPLALMERAAGHLARAILAAGGRGYGLRVALLCGKGNNGGDGIAAARRLRAAGAAPVVCLVAGEEGLSHDAAVQLARWRALGGRVTDSVHAALTGADVAVDCLLGTGARGEPRSPYREAIAALDEARAGGAAVVACDIPSGVDADTGAVADVAVRADVTVTLGAHKRGLWLWPARRHCGRIVLGDLGIVDSDDAEVARVLEPADVAALVPPPAPDSHKRSRGVVVVVAGSPGMTGAAALVARGAMGAGAGLVTVASSPAALARVAPVVPEALTAALPDDDPDAAFAALGGLLARADAVAIGPGLGHAETTVALVRRLVREVEVPIVLDADGLNAFRGDGDALADHRAPLLVVTPHAGELARLVRGSASAAAEVTAQRVTLVPEKAAAWRAVVVAKGPGTLVAAPDGRVWINPTGTAALASGGTGDVLTGITSALVAQRAEADSVAAAVWLHGRAGQLAGSGRAARAVTALDVVARLHAVLEELD
ncbi:MAG TPA: NAD(P)H-hydrate dehydratase, partial [Egibacteraceae bacterium]